MLAVLCLGAAAALADTRVALVIGNSTYKNVARLENPVRDARAVAEVLKQIGFQVTLALDQDRDGMEAALRSFRRAVADSDIAAVYYAGHGMEANGENYLIPTDATLATDDDIDFELLRLDLVLQSLARARTLRLVILDACRNNPFAATMTASGGTRSVGRGFVRIEPSSNTLVAYAAKAGTLAEDGAGDHSPFATALLRYLAEPGLAINFLFGKVRDDVLAATAGKQEPFVYGSLGGEAAYLVPPAAVPAPPPSPPAPAATPSLEALFWESIKDSRFAGDYEAYLAQFPNGTFAKLAQARLARAKVEAVQAQPDNPPAQVAALTPPPAGPEIEDLDATYVARQAIAIRAKPEAGAKAIGKRAADEAVAVTGRVKGTDWLRVQVKDRPGYVEAAALAPVDATEVADWKALQAAPKLEAAQAFLRAHPAGYFKPRAEALVAQLTPPPEPETDPFDATYVAREATAIRAKPEAGAKTIGKLAADAAVATTGRVRGTDWLRVQVKDRPGYVEAAALAPVDATEVADWKALQAAPKLEAAQAFLQAHPGGYFKPRAEALVAQLTPPPEPEIDPLDGTYVAQQSVNLRARPDTKADVITRLAEDDAVSALGRVKGKDWLKVKAGEKTGYVSAGLVAKVDAAEVAAWAALQPSPTLKSAEAFVAAYPNGYFKEKAGALVESLRPPVPAAKETAAPQSPATPAPAGGNQVAAAPASPAKPPAPPATAPQSVAPVAPAAKEGVQVGQTYALQGSFSAGFTGKGSFTVRSQDGPGSFVAEGDIVTMVWGAQEANRMQMTIVEDGETLSIQGQSSNGGTGGLRLSLHKTGPGKYYGSGVVSSHSGRVTVALTGGPAASSPSEPAADAQAQSASAVTAKPATQTPAPEPPTAPGAIAVPSTTTVLQTQPRNAVKVGQAYILESTLRTSSSQAGSFVGARQRVIKERIVIRDVDGSGHFVATGGGNGLQVHGKLTITQSGDELQIAFATAAGSGRVRLKALDHGKFEGTGDVVLSLESGERARYSGPVTFLLSNN